MISALINQKIKEKTLALGFDACGFTSRFEPVHADYFGRWVDERRFSGMEWLGKNTSLRLQPNTILPGCRSIISVAVSYKHQPDSSKDYQIARYAYGKDYHLWIKEKLECLANWIHSEIYPQLVWRSFVDTGPILERDLAAKAGLGWVGRNTCLINKDLGSYVFLGEILTNMELEESVPALDLCGKCTLCIDLCPTQALKPYQLEPQKCLAYQNIEKHGERDREFRNSLGNNLVGCDICQDVCPWNRKPDDTHQKTWTESFSDFVIPDLKGILQLTKTAYRNKIKNSAISRIRYEDFMRNVFLVILNTKRLDLFVEVKGWGSRNSSLKLLEYDDCLAQLQEWHQGN
jgi:epoxyqueuosine reductase